MTVLLIQWLVVGCFLAAGAGLAIRLVPAGAAAERHLLWWAALVAVLVIPVLPLLIDTAAPATAGASAVAPYPAAPLTVPELPSRVMALVAAVWAATTVLSLARVAIAMVSLRRLERRATPLTSVAVEAARGARTLVSPEVSGACAVGYLRPSIIVSADLVSAVDEATLRSIVCHESAHLARRDDWSRLAQRVVLAVAGLHPAVRWISRQIDIECEAACDQYVVSRTQEPVAYAQSLARAAELTLRVRASHAALAPGMSATGRGLHARVNRILHAAPVRPAVRTAVSLASLAAVGASAAGSLLLPPIVALEIVERPLATLASAPLGRDVIAALPSGRGLTSTLVRNDSAPVAVQPAQTGQAPAGPTTAASSEPVDAVADGPATPVAAEPLLAAPVRTFEIPAFAAADAAEPQAGIGATAARKGTAAGTAASRAGQSIGRFFTRGGQAIAGRF